MKRSLCVFCGSRPGASSAFTDAARELGRAITRAGFGIVYGGGDVGLMGILAGAALDAGGVVRGIIPRRLLDREVAKEGLTELVVTATMFERKERMIAESDGFIVLPGGFGTLDELLEVLTLRQLGYHDKPIVLLEVDGFWGPCLAFFEQIVTSGFAEPSVERLFALAEDVPTALEIATNGRRAAADD